MKIKQKLTTLLAFICVFTLYGCNPTYHKWKITVTEHGIGNNEYETDSIKHIISKNGDKVLFKAKSALVTYGPEQWRTPNSNARITGYEALPDPIVAKKEGDHRDKETFIVTCISGLFAMFCIFSKFYLHQRKEEKEIFKNKNKNHTTNAQE